MLKNVRCTSAEAPGIDDGRARQALGYAFALAGGSWRTDSLPVSLSVEGGLLRVTWHDRIAQRIYGHYIDRGWVETSEAATGAHHYVEGDLHPIVELAMIGRTLAAVPKPETSSTGERADVIRVPTAYAFG